MNKEQLVTLSQRELVVAREQQKPSIMDQLALKPVPGDKLKDKALDTDARQGRSKQ